MFERRAMFLPTNRCNVPLAPEAAVMSVLDSIAAITSCSRAQDIYRPGDEAGYWYRVVAGLARKCADTANGQRQIVDLLMPGDFFGFATGKEHQFGAEAAVKGTIIARYPRRRLEMLADVDPEFARLIRQVAFKAISRLQSRMLVLGRTTAREKVGAFLLEMANRSSEGAPEGVTLPMSRYDIADYLAISVETVSRSLTDLRQRGSIRLTTTRHVQIVDRRALTDATLSAGIDLPGRRGEASPVSDSDARR
jgi:CRP/FNR family transcriptional regulator, nitrogen fixation regulation protein